MVSKTELMGLGMPYPQANVVGVFPQVTSVGGQTAPSAPRLGGTRYLNMITASNSGSGLRLPQVTGDEIGCYNGDTFRIFNALTATICIYADNNAQGSAVTIMMNATSAAGTTGMSLGTGQMALLYPMTPSTWVGIKSSV